MVLCLEMFTCAARLTCFNKIVSELWRARCEDNECAEIVLFKKTS